MRSPGGYRRTPFLQVGADIYCDTALICDVLEHVQPEPTLYPPHLKGVSRVFAQWADTTLFWAAMAYNLQPKGAQAIFGKARPKPRRRSRDDRKAMRGNMVRLRPGDATSAYRSYLRRIAHMVEEHDFLFGTGALRRGLRDVSLAVVHARPGAGARRHPDRHTCGKRVDGPHRGDRAWRQWRSSTRPMRSPWRKGRATPPGARTCSIDSAFRTTTASRSAATRHHHRRDVRRPEPTQGVLLAATRTHYTLAARRRARRQICTCISRASATCCERPGPVRQALMGAVHFCVFDTAIGPCGIAWTADAIAACQLPEADRAATLARMQRRFPEAQAGAAPEWVAKVIARVQALLEGGHDDLADVPLELRDEPEFNCRVYEIARAIPPGRTLTYGDIAKRMGDPGAARAVGQALGHNPFAPIVPCHRILGAGNSGTGFSANGGVATKLKMLESNAPSSDRTRACSTSRPRA